MSFEQGSVCFLVVTETKDIIGKCSLLGEKVSVAHLAVVCCSVLHFDSFF